MAKSSSSTYDILTPSDNVSFDVEGFDHLIADNGIRFIHQISTPCPIGLTDPYDIHPHSKHDTCSNGHIYENAGIVTAYLSGNQNIPFFEDVGIADGSTVQITLRQKYDDKDVEIRVSNYDRFYLHDYKAEVITKERFEHNQTGIDKLRYPVLNVELLIDSRGNKYTPGVDFVIVDSKIKWIGKQPTFDPKEEKGEVCSVRYTYVPFWYCDKLLHEIRVTRNHDTITGEDKITRLPYAVLLAREYIFENSRNDDDALTGASPSRRSVQAPRKGSFGPR